MLKIAHRGNLYGPSEYENSPWYILDALSMGFQAEVDLWLIDDQLFLGHDEIKYPIDSSFMLNILVIDNTWFHCKNLNALNYLIDSEIDYKFFWHQEDNHSLTSNGIVWTYPGKATSKNSIIVHLEENLPDRYLQIYGVCGDYVGLW